MILNLAKKKRIIFYNNISLHGRKKKSNLKVILVLLYSLDQEMCDFNILTNLIFQLTMLAPCHLILNDSKLESNQQALYCPSHTPPPFPFVALKQPMSGKNRQLVADEAIDLGNNWLKLETSVELLIIVEGFMEYTAN